MKLTQIHSRPASQGFTLIELMVVIGIMGLLASLTFMGFQHAQTSAMRQKTESFKTAIISSLEHYNHDFGEYPQQRSDTVSKFGASSYHVGGALMLYQALSGDGTNEMKLSTGGGKPSDGKLDDNEIPNIMMDTMPTDMWMKTSDGYMCVDGFGKPFQYTKYTNSTGGTHAATGQAVLTNNITINTTYDLWSFAGDEKNTNDVSLATKQDSKVSAKWIKNW